MLSENVHIIAMMESLFHQAFLMGRVIGKPDSPPRANESSITSLVSRHGQGNDEYGASVCKQTNNPNKSSPVYGLFMTIVPGHPFEVGCGSVMSPRNELIYTPKPTLVIDPSIPIVGFGIGGKFDKHVLSRMTADRCDPEEMDLKKPAKKQKTQAKLSFGPAKKPRKDQA